MKIKKHNRHRRWYRLLCASFFFFALGGMLLPGHMPGSSDAWAQRVRCKTGARCPGPLVMDSYMGHLTVPIAGGKHRTLVTRKVSVKVTVRGRIARTEVDQVFYNPLSRQTEGTYTFQLPEGAAIVRLAMDVNGKMVEGELVERTKARAIYTSIVRRMKDPALLEWQSGNRFRTQIFPIPARGTKRVILSYDHVLDSNHHTVNYAYHLSSAPKGPKIGAFSFKLVAHGASKLAVRPYNASVIKDKQALVASFNATNFRSVGHLKATITMPSHKGMLYAGTVAGKKYGVLMLPLQLKALRTAYKNRVVILDTSAGMRGIALAKAKKLAETLLNTLPSGGSFGLIAGDVSVRLFRKQMAQKSAVSKAIAFIRKQEARGATDLQAIFSAAIKLAGNNTEVIYIGDGVVSTGEMDTDLLVSALKKQLGNKSLRMSAVGLGPQPDMGFLGRLARQTGGRALQMHLQQTADHIVTELQNLSKMSQLSDIAYTIKGMKQVIRFQKGLLASGDMLMLAGEMVRPAVRVTVTGKVNGTQAFRMSGVFEASASPNDKIAPAFWARWSIAKWEREAKKKRHIIQVSKAFGVMSRYTSFLVLENDKAYKKHNIKRRKHQNRLSGLTGKDNAGKKRVTTKSKGRKNAIRQWMRGGSNQGETRVERESAGDGFADSPRGRGLGGAPGSGSGFGRRARARGFRFAPSAPNKKAKIGYFGGKRYRRPSRRWYRRYKPVPFATRLKQARQQLARNPMSWWAHRRLVSLLMSKKHLRSKALVAIRNWRKYAWEHSTPIRFEAQVLKQLGKVTESRRVLSELVEFSPHSYVRRVQYARELERFGNITKACSELTQAVRLNPARRDTFRKMMGLYRARRSNTEYKDIVQQCIVKGVSRLPVVRDISMVLFWDDPKADIDLHVIEPGGEKVYYRKKESKQGGTLYYDIMNGFGPEVYVLGTGKPGAYRVSAVYFSGKTPVITGKLVVLENAGSTREIRKVYNIKLVRKNGKKPVSITTIHIKK